MLMLPRQPFEYRPKFRPWYGYQRIAVMCRREAEPVTDRQVYRVMREHDLLHKPRPYELLPRRPNELWQTDMTYIHIPGFGWPISTRSASRFAASPARRPIRPPP